jgi:hypothetical protein
MAIKIKVNAVDRSVHVDSDLDGGYLTLFRSDRAQSQM